MLLFGYEQKIEQYLVPFSPLFYGIRDATLKELGGGRCGDPFSPLFYGIRDATVIEPTKNVQKYIYFQSPILRDS